MPRHALQALKRKSYARAPTARSICEMRSLLVLVLMAGTTAADTEATCALPVQAGVHVDTRADDDQVVATIVFDDGRQRVVRAASCGELLDSVTLIIAMALSAPVSVASAIRTSTAIETASEHDLLVTGAGAWSSHNWQQAVLVGVRWRDGDRSLDAELRLDAPDRQSVTTTGSVDVWTSAASVSPCLHRGAFAGCAIATLGVIEGAGSGLADTRRAFTPLVAGGVRLAWEHPLSDRFTLRLQLDAEAALTTTRLDVDHMTVWTSDPVATR